MDVFPDLFVPSFRLIFRASLRSRLPMLSTYFSEMQVVRSGDHFFSPR